MQVRGCTGWREQRHAKMTPGTLEFVNEDDTTLLRLELQNEKGLYYCGINGSAEEHKGGVAEGKVWYDWINNIGPSHVSNTIVKVVTWLESQLVSQETYSGCATAQLSGFGTLTGKKGGHLLGNAHHSFASMALTVLCGSEPWSAIGQKKTGWEDSGWVNVKARTGEGRACTLLVAFALRSGALQARRRRAGSATSRPSANGREGG